MMCALVTAVALAAAPLLLVLLLVPPCSAMSSGAVAAGAAFSCVIFEGGVVKCWGDNNTGQLGNGNSETVGDGDGEMGDDLKPVLLGEGAVAVKIAAGFQHACVMLDTAKIKCWGANSFGQLGLGHSTPRGNNAAFMGDNLPIVDLGTNYEAIAIACGADSSCAILADRRLKCWGRNFAGQLGLGNMNDRGDGPNEMGNNLPFVKVQGDDLVVVTVALGTSHTCTIAVSGDLFCWGYGGNGELGVPAAGNPIGDLPEDMANLQPVDLGTGRSAIGITLGSGYTCVLLNVAAVACFGYNGFGQLGIGSNNNIGDDDGEMGDKLQTVDLGTGRSAVQVSVSDRHSCAVLDDGSMKCWGRNNYGQLGLGDTNNRGVSSSQMGDNLPAVNLGTGRTAVWIELGSLHSCALLDDASLKCWGANFYGQLGQGNTTDRGGNGDAMGDILPPIDFGASTITDFCQLGEYGTFGDCTSCPAGTWAPVGIETEEECVACSAGTFSPEGATSCFSCPVGTYSNVIGAADNSTCLPCAAGRYSGIEGADEEADCLLCPAGTYSGAEGATDDGVCEACGKGMYSEVEGATSPSVCELCPSGTYSKVQGLGHAKGCQPCSAGRYSEAEGADHEADCLACGAGRYSEVEGANSSTTCLPCPPKTHTEGDGASDIAMCKKKQQKKEDEAAGVESVMQDPGMATSAALNVILVIAVALLLLKLKKRRESGHTAGAIPTPSDGSGNADSAEVAMTDLATATKPGSRRASSSNV